MSCFVSVTLATAVCLERSLVRKAHHLPPVPRGQWRAPVSQGGRQTSLYVHAFQVPVVAAVVLL